MLGINEIDVDTLAQWKEEGENFRLIDIRTDAEIAQGVIEGTEVIPMHLIPLKINEFSGDEKVVIYCRSGNRSGQVCAFLAQNGAGSNAYNLRGGIISWARSGYPLTTLQKQGVSAA
jgi:rhodanese-related sulfurtransferase